MVFLRCLRIQFNSTSLQTPLFIQHIAYECKEKEKDKIKIKIQTIKIHHQENYCTVSKYSFWAYTTPIIFHD